MSLLFEGGRAVGSVGRAVVSLPNDLGTLSVLYIVDC